MRTSSYVHTVGNTHPGLDGLGWPHHFDTQDSQFGSQDVVEEWLKEDEHRDGVKKEKKKSVGHTRDGVEKKRKVWATPEMVWKRRKVWDTPGMAWKRRKDR